MTVVRQSLRGLVRSRAFTTVTVASLGAAVGLVCSVASVIDAAYFTALPYAEPERLVELWQTPGPGSSQPQDYLQPSRMEDWARASDLRSLESIAGTGLGTVMMMPSEAGSIRVRVEPVVGDWFGTLGVSAVEGRLLVPEDLAPDAAPVVVVSDRFRRNHLPRELGTVRLSGMDYTVVGVMPKGFDSDEKVWVARESLPEGIAPAAYAGVGRLRDAASEADAKVEIEQLAAVQVASDSSRFGGFGATARLMGTQRPSATMLWILVGVAGAVVLVGLSNLTTLFLVRAQHRGAEVAIRTSLGATRTQIGRAMATESMMVAVCGALLGVALSLWGKDLVVSLVGGEYVFPADPRVSPVVLGVALTLALAACALLGIEPIRRLASLDPGAVLRGNAGFCGTTLAERRTRRLLVAAQVGTSVVLSVGVAVLWTAYRHLEQLDLGYDADRVVHAVPDYPLAGLDVQAQWNVAERVIERAATRPEAEGAAAWRPVGIDYPPRPEFAAVIDGPPVELATRDRLAWYYEVTPGFFEVMGIPILRGRSFSRQSAGPPSRPVAILTERAANALWGDDQAVGRQIKLGQEGVWMTVVGIARDLERLDLLGRETGVSARRPPLLFMPQDQFAALPAGWRGYACTGCDGVMLGVRAGPSVPATKELLLSILSQEAPTLPIHRFGTLQEVQMRGYSGGRLRVAGRMLEVGVVVALALALVGIAGMVAEGVARRRKELGIRLALGATSLDVLRTTLRESLVSLVLGTVAGVVAIRVLDGTLESFRFRNQLTQLSADIMDPSLLLPAVFVVLIVSLGMAVAVASRALLVEPAEALRAEP